MMKPPTKYALHESSVFVRTVALNSPVVSLGLIALIHLLISPGGRYALAWAVSYSVGFALAFMEIVSPSLTETVSE